MFRQFMMIAMSIVTSIVLMWSGIWLTWGYYSTDIPLHDVFSFTGPLLIAVGFALPLLVIGEIE